MKEAKFYMKKIIRYQCRSDLKWIRQINQLPKEFVAAYIGYSTRTLERIEAENAVADEGTAKRLCCIYDMNFKEVFYEIDKRCDDWVKEQMANMADGMRKDGYLLPYNGDTGDRLYGVREKD